VLTFYAAQVAAIRAAADARGLRGVFTATVDGAQGSEADVVLLSCVRCRGVVGFLADERRLNVGLTRARHQLLILADVETLASGSKGRTALAALVRHAASARCLHEWSAGSSPPRLSDEACARLMERTTDAPHASPAADQPAPHPDRPDRGAAGAGARAEGERAARVEELRRFQAEAAALEASRLAKKREAVHAAAQPFRPPYETQPEGGVRSTAWQC